MFAPPQKKLVNLTGNIWVTPKGPQTPSYSNMFSPKSFGVNFTLVQDACNIGVQATPVIAHINLPSFQIVLRDPNCSPGPFLTPPPQDEDSYTHYFEDIELGFLFSFDGVPATSYESRLITEDDFRGSRPPSYYGEAWARGGVQMEFVGSRWEVPEAQRKMIGMYTVSVSPFVQREAYANLEWIFTRYSYFISNDRFARVIQNSQSQTLSFDLNGVSQSSTFEVFKGYALVSVDSNGLPLQILRRQFYQIVDGEEVPTSLVRDFYGVQIIEESEIRVRYPPEFDNQILIDDQSDRRVYITRRKKHFIFILSDYNPSPPPPPPPPKLPPKPPMNCCPELRQLLQLILLRIGNTDLPATVPTSLTKKDSPPTKIQNLAQFIAYGIRQENAQFGVFPQQIKIEDADLTQEGNQSRTVELPNLAEAIAEMTGILLLIQAESSATLTAAVNAMIEAGAAKQSAIVANDILLANAEYLGYKLENTNKEIPYTFTPGEAKLDKALQPKAKVPVKTYKNGDKDNLLDLVAPILEMAAMYRAQNFVNLGTGDIAQSLKKKLEELLKNNEDLDTLTKNNPNPNNSEGGEWDDFLNQAEQGFINQPGITDTTQPYGRPLNQRPRIREIGNTSEDQP